MNAQKKKRLMLKRRQTRIRQKTRGGSERPRLVVNRSTAHIYAQIIDAASGETLAAVSTTQTKVKAGLKSTGNVEAAKVVGKQIAEVTRARGITAVRFDRGGRKYHGRVKALAEAAREAGLTF